MILMNIPIAYATEIKQSIEQSKSAAYYQETVDEQQAAAIPEKSVNTENQAQQPRDAEAKEATKQAPKQEVEPPTRLPELSEAKVNQE